MPRIWEIKETWHQRDLMEENVSPDVISCGSCFTSGQWVFWELHKRPLKYEPRFSSVHGWRSGWGIPATLSLSASSAWGLPSSFSLLSAHAQTQGPVLQSVCLDAKPHPQAVLTAGWDSSSSLEAVCTGRPSPAISHWAVRTVRLAKQVHC